MGLFESVIEKCDKEYNRHYDRKRDSWLGMTYQMLFEMVKIAYNDLILKMKSGDKIGAFEQVLDLINLLFMFECQLSRKI